MKGDGGDPRHRAHQLTSTRGSPADRQRSGHVQSTRRRQRPDKLTEGVPRLLTWGRGSVLLPINVTHLTSPVAGSPELWKHKKRNPSRSAAEEIFLPDSHIQKQDFTRPLTSLDKTRSPFDDVAACPTAFQRRNK